MFFTKRCPSGGTEHVSFELFLGILRGPGEGRGGAPGTVPLQNPEVTSRKACLRNAEKYRTPARIINSRQSRFSGVCLVFDEVFQDTCRSNKESPSACWNAALSCPFMASNYANSYVVLISFWMLTMPWILNPISFYRRPSRFAAFQTRVAHLCFCLVRIKCRCSYNFSLEVSTENNFDNPHPPS